MATRQVLSQDEIEALASALGVKRLSKESRTKHVRNYDFVNPDKLSGPNLRALQLIFTNTARFWSSILHDMLRMDVIVQAEPPSEVKFSDYAESSRSRSLVFEVSLSPLPGNAFLETPISLVRAIVDRMAGGNGEVRDTNRPLTKIEENIAKVLFGKLMGKFADACNPVIALTTAISKCQSSVAGTQIANEDDVLVAGMTWAIGSMQSCINVAIPVSTLDPILSELDPQAWLRIDQPAESSEPSSMTGLLQSVDVPVAVELGRARVSVHDVLNMEVGDVVRLGSTVKDSLNVKISGKPRFSARPGLVGNRFSVQISEKAGSMKNIDAAE